MNIPLIVDVDLFNGKQFIENEQLAKNIQQACSTIPKTKNVTSDSDRNITKISLFCM